MPTKYGEEHEYVEIKGKKHKVIHPKKPKKKKRIHLLVKE